MFVKVYNLIQTDNQSKIYLFKSKKYFCQDFCFQESVIFSIYMFFPTYENHGIRLWYEKTYDWYFVNKRKYLEKMIRKKNQTISKHSKTKNSYIQLSILLEYFHSKFKLF